MWGRVIEIMAAVWLALSPFFFLDEASSSIILTDSLLALLIAVLSGLSYWHPTRHAHVATLFVATGLILWGRFANIPPPPIHQNHIVIGLFLLMIAIIPNQASRPPRAWREEMT